MTEIEKMKKNIDLEHENSRKKISLMHNAISAHREKQTVPVKVLLDIMRERYRASCEYSHSFMDNRMSTGDVEGLIDEALAIMEKEKE